MSIEQLAIVIFFLGMGITFFIMLIVDLCTECTRGLLPLPPKPMS